MPPANSLIVGTPKHLKLIFLHTIVKDKQFYTLMCLKNFLLKQTSSKINNSGEKFCNNLSCFFLTPITPVLLSGNLLNYTGCSIITSRTIRVKSRILKQFLLYFKTLSNLEQCPTWVRSPLFQK